MLTARDAVVDRVDALDAGADDYLTKPFSFAELFARLRAVARRGPVERPTTLEVGDLRLDPAERRVWRGEQEIELSTREFAVLELLMRRAGVALTRLQLLEGAWDMAFESRSKHRRRLRAVSPREGRPAVRSTVDRDRTRGRLSPAEGRVVSRLPIRVRLTLPFALGMAVGAGRDGCRHLRPRRQRAARVRRPEPERPGVGGG